MVVTETATSWIAWWGACLSSLLAVVKLFELWRDRFRVDVDYYFTGDESIGNKILIRNLSGRPIILTHWELIYCSGSWPRRKFDFLEKADIDAGDRKLEPYATHTICFFDENYFSWDHKALNGRRIFIRLHIAGRKSILKIIYPH
jgi:hypothetical protein